VGDVLAGVAFLKGQAGIDPRRIGLCGHSEGGVIAPMAAARSKDVAFIVMMAGTGVPGDEIIIRQGYLIGKAQGANEAALKRQTENQRTAFAIVKKEKDPAEIKRQLTALRDEEIARLPADQQKAAVGQEAAFKASLASLESRWFQYFLSLDPREALRKVRCPVLIVNGEKDLQVEPAQNVGEIEKALKQAGNKDVTVHILPGMNHLFQTCTTGSPTEYSTIEETMSPTALQTIGDWIAGHTKPARPPAKASR
jgi:pimeloyl-ACP methyl ester carboxylesterase